MQTRYLIADNRLPPLTAVVVGTRDPEDARIYRTKEMFFAGEHNSARNLARAFGCRYVVIAQPRAPKAEGV